MKFYTLLIMSTIFSINASADSVIGCRMIKSDGEALLDSQMLFLKDRKRLVFGKFLDDNVYAVFDKDKIGHFGTLKLYDLNKGKPISQHGYNLSITLKKGSYNYGILCYSQTQTADYLSHMISKVSKSFKEIKNKFLNTFDKKYSSAIKIDDKPRQREKEIINESVSRNLHSSKKTNEI